MNPENETKPTEAIEAGNVSHSSRLPRSEREVCDVCHSPKAAPPEFPNDTICRCNGLQPYAMSTYPGEYKLVRCHPNNGGEMFYRRSDVDALLEKLNFQNTKLRNGATEYE